MSENKKNAVRVVLTEEQQSKIKQETGREVSEIEFTAEQLEDRIAPVKLL
jgi:hypothetical protein